MYVQFEARRKCCTTNILAIKLKVRTVAGRAEECGCARYVTADLSYEMRELETPKPKIVDEREKRKEHKKVVLHCCMRTER